MKAVLRELLKFCLFLPRWLIKHRHAPRSGAAAMPALLRGGEVMSQHKAIEQTYKDKVAARRKDRFENPQKYLGKEDDEFD
jgi:hypothetical protein